MLQNLKFVIQTPCYGRTALAGRSIVVWLCETTAQITEDLSLWEMAINFSTRMIRDSFDGTSFG